MYVEDRSIVHLDEIIGKLEIFTYLILKHKFVIVRATCTRIISGEFDYH